MSLLAEPSHDTQSLYDKHEKYIHATIYKKYNSPAFLDLHGLSIDELIQFGRIGLQNACETYNQSKGKSFRSYAIDCIGWSIQNLSRKNSLSNINTESFEVVDRVSFDVEVPSTDEESCTLYDVVEYTETGYESFEVESFLTEVRETISAEMETIVRLKMDNIGFAEIGQMLGVSKQAAHQIYKKNVDKLQSLYSRSL